MSPLACNATACHLAALVLGLYVRLRRRCSASGADDVTGKSNRKPPRPLGASTLAVLPCTRCVSVLTLPPRCAEMAASSFVGTQLVLTQRAPVAQRRTFSVQANTSGPKKVNTRVQTGPARVAGRVPGKATSTTARFRRTAAWTRPLVHRHTAGLVFSRGRQRRTAERGAAGRAGTDNKGTPCRE